MFVRRRGKGKGEGGGKGILSKFVDKNSGVFFVINVIHRTDYICVSGIYHYTNVKR